jgi:hypothetical protein
MGLLVKSTADKKIKISGTDFELEQVYARISFVAKPNGREMEIAFGIFASYEMFLEGKILFTNIPEVNFNAVLPEGVEQSTSSALEQAKLGFEQMGYVCEIVSDGNSENIIEEPQPITPENNPE